MKGDSTPAVGCIEAMLSGPPGQGVNGSSTPPADPIDTVFSGIPGQGVNSNDNVIIIVHRLCALG